MAKEKKKGRTTPKGTQSTPPTPEQQQQMVHPRVVQKLMLEKANVEVQKASLECLLEDAQAENQELRKQLDEIAGKVVNINKGREEEDDEDDAEGGAASAAGEGR